ncbi:MAG TPA: ABC transporter ATP-binding protein [Patescibacteria group bacterium]|jgi:iron complex transport system ATP-binding protein|nr:ABC transporter ATP-binding protein [Patescibacteria group bacterium]
MKASNVSSAPPAIEARGLRFSYRETPVFDGLDLQVAAGQMLALIGPNGSGKTTLLKLLGGALRPVSGEVLIEGHALPSLAPRERARRVAVVPQDTAMTFDFSVLETVLMGRTAYLGLFGIEGAEDLAAARQAMRRTGTEGFSTRLLSHLSGGERQLVVIARALAQQPRLLLLDEPTAFLDIRHRLEIYGLLSRLNVEEGLTIVITSHDINLAARFCRRIVLIKAGRVRADGAPAEVFRAGILSDVYETPLQILADASTGTPFAVPA